MLNKNKDKSLLKESLLEMKMLDDVMMRSTKSSLSNILKEQVKQELKNIIAEADDFEEDDSESGDAEVENIEDGSQDTASETGEELEGEDSGDVEGEEDLTDTEDGEGMDSEFGEEGDLDTELNDDEEDVDLEDFKTGEDEYDLTNSDIEDVVRVFKKVDDNDSVIVRKLENGKVDLRDSEVGTEYIIDMDGDDGVGVEVDDEEVDLDLNEEIEIELDDEEDMVDEKSMTQSIGTNRRAGRMTQTRREYAPGAGNRDGSKLIAAESKKIANEYAARLKKIEEAYAKRMKSLNEEVSQYKKALTMFRDKLKENAVLNNNLAKYVKLVTENATTKDEKLQILERFAKEANTIETGNKLFESINSSLKSKDVIIMTESKQSVEQPKRLVEQVVYQSKDLKETIDLINRINKL